MGRKKECLCTTWGINGENTAHNGCPVHAPAEKPVDLYPLVSRLRCNYLGRDFSGPMQVVLPTAIMLEAAEVIERLEKEQELSALMSNRANTQIKAMFNEIQGYRDALQELAEFGSSDGCQCFRVARKALGVI